MKAVRAIPFSAGLVLTALTPLPAAIVSLPAAKDNTLFQVADGSLSNGAGDYLFAGTTAGELLRRGLIAFDLAGILPAGAILQTVELQLHASRTPAAGEFVSLHRAIADWGEGGSDAPAEEGGGALAQPADATWLHGFYPDTFWNTPGGDFDPDPSDSQIVIGTGWYTWSSPALTADVQNWIDNPLLNFGWVVIGEEGTAMTAKRFDSREHPDPALRPMLTISYEIPEPASLVLAGTAIAVLLGCRPCPGQLAAPKIHRALAAAGDKPAPAGPASPGE